MQPGTRPVVVEPREVVTMMALVIVVLALAISVIGGALIGPAKPNAERVSPWFYG